MPKSDKICMLDFTLNKLKSLKNEYDEVGLIGGEFFNHQLDEPEVYRKFFEISALCLNPKFKKFYITASLIYKDLTDLFEFFDTFQDERILLCTSYDTLYRFHNDIGKRLWENNIKILHKRYPNLKIHTEIILTQDFLEKVVNDEFSVAMFQREFGTNIDFIQAQCNTTLETKAEIDFYLPKFIPHRKTFLEFLQKVRDEGSVNIYNLLNKNLHSSTFYTEVNGKVIEVTDRRENWDRIGLEGYREMGRKFFDLGYIDSEKTLESDIEMFKKFM